MQVFKALQACNLLNMVSNNINKTTSLLVICMILLVAFISAACHSGLLPCPKIKTVRMKKNSPHKSFFEPSESLIANAKDQNEDLHSKSYRGSDGKMIKNISVEEWDCPRPGVKKYMPKNVKENIRRNMQKIKSSEKNPVDSLSSSSSYNQ